ncbi:hypothetical protein CPC08DRAFT_821866 [Agrocybe pediades]|nr:hypothetical protein CPC08DRAFT_821866 [Agrocybe pediades]
MEDIIKSSPCRLLPPELLLEVFRMNTERDDSFHNRLNTARHSSQVCRLWRTIHLSSASIWGRLLQLDDFLRTKDEWKDLVLSRVGNALLWVHGRISTSTWRFFVKVLDSKWENVQILDVWENPVSRFCPPGAGSFLGKPAPNLESLVLRLYNRWPLPQPLTLFNNIAPRLRAIEASPIFFHVDSPLPWLYNLRTLSFLTTHSIADILSVLKWVPHLKLLRIWRDSGSKRIVRVPHELLVPIHLPKLQSLHIINGNLSEILPFLELITPSPICSIAIHTTCLPVSRQESFDALPTRFYRALLPWISAYMKGRPPKFISLDVDSEPSLSLRIRDYPPPPPSYKPSSIEEDSLDVAVLLDSYCRSALAELTRASSRIFSSVEQLSVYVEYKRDPDILLPFYEAFTSVTELTLEAYTAIDFMDLHAERKRDASVLFPRMRTLCITVEDGSMVEDATIVSRILDFVEYRASVGLPLSCLDLSEGIRGIELSDRDRERLGTLEGLTVKFPA